MIQRPPRSTRTDTLFPYTTLFRSPQKTLSDATGYRRFQAGDFVVRFDVKARYRRARADAKVAALCDARTFNRLRIAGRAARRKNDARAGRNSQPAIACAKDGLKLPAVGRSEERRVGKECVSTCRYRWSPYH